MSARTYTVRAILAQPSLVAWALFVFALPFYLGKNGLPQPGNMLIVIVAPLALSGWDGRLDSAFVRPLRLLFWFTIWVLLIDLGWAAVLQTWSIDTKESTLLLPIYYFYNLLVFLAALVMYHRHGDKLLATTLYAVLASVAVQVIATSFHHEDSDLRGGLYFNNPNQLGFYALLAACVVALCQRRLKLGLVPASVALLACAYLAFISASRAAVGGIGLLFFLLVLSNPRLVMIAMVGAFALLTLGGPVARALDSTERRVELRSQSNEDIVSSRGYQRILDFPEHLAIGAGEGNTLRFVEDPKRALEIHSSFATVAFSYGIVGFALFAAFLWSVIRGVRPRTAMLIAPVLAYNLTHQGLRTTMLWIVLAVFIMLKTSGPPRVGHLAAER